MTLLTFQVEVDFLPQQLLPAAPPVCAASSTDAEKEKANSGAEPHVETGEEESTISCHLLEQEPHETTHPSVTLGFKRMF